MNKKVRFGVLALAIYLALGTPIRAAAAGDDAQVSEAKSLVAQALSEKTFYTYNIAYFSILKVQDKFVYDTLLSQLAVISTQIYTPQILHYLDLLSQVAKTASGKIYDQTEAEIRGSNLNSFDKGYLLGELTGWGMQMVYTPDYINGVGQVVNGWSNIYSDNFYSVLATAKTEVNKVASLINKDYLLGELDKVKAVQEKNTDVVKRVTQIKASSLTTYEKVVELQKLLVVTNSLVIPNGYNSGAGVYAISDSIFSSYAKNPTSIADIQTIIDKAVVTNEAAKFKGQFNTGEYVELKANTGSIDIDVTSQVAALIYPLSEGVQYSLAAPAVPSGYLTLNVGKVYLTTKAVSSPIDDSIVLTVSYKGASTTTQIKIKILP